MTTLRWPDGRGIFRDTDTDRTPDDIDVLEVRPGTTVDVSDQDTVDHYLDRGFEAVGDRQDPSGADDDADESPADDADPGADAAEDGFDADAFVDRTPVSDVVEDIEAGDADGHLDEVADADDRATVQKAVDDRRDVIGGE